MITFRYIGDHPDLQDELALGKWCFDGHYFAVQCNGHLIGQTPFLDVDGVDWAHGWHRTPREDWAFVEEPKFIGSRDNAADFIRANRFTLDCHVFHDSNNYVVFGSPST